MLTLVVWVYESEQEIPSTLKEFFEKLFHVVFTRHDSLKAGFKREHFSGLSESKLQALFEAFCFMVVQNGFGRSMNRSNFNEAFIQAIEYSEGCECDVDNFRKDIVKVACLMLEEGVDLTTFLHKSILDYFAAAFIIHNDDDLAQDFYSEAFDNFPDWMHTIHFLTEVDKYRYSRHYILRHLPECTTWLNTTLSVKGKDALYKAIISKIRGFSLMLNREGEFLGWQTESPARDHFFMDLDRSIMLPCLSIFKKDAPHGLISKLAPPITSDNPKEPFEVNLKKLIAHLGEEPFREQLQTLDLLYREQIEKAENIVNTQAKQKLIFGKKTKPKSVKANT